jgi:hypothetical protein
MKFKTKDIGLASFLILNKCEYTTEMENNVVIFHFPEMNKESVDSYWTSECYRYKNTIDSLKKMIDIIKSNY